MQLTAKITLVGLFYLSLALLSKSTLNAATIVESDSSVTQQEDQSLGLPELNLFNGNNPEDESVLHLKTTEDDSLTIISRQANVVNHSQNIWGSIWQSLQRLRFDGFSPATPIDSSVVLIDIDRIMSNRGLDPVVNYHHQELVPDLLSEEIDNFGGVRFAVNLPQKPTVELPVQVYSNYRPGVILPQRLTSFGGLRVGVELPTKPRTYLPMTTDNVSFGNPQL
ncbi:MAG: hypothetical protein EA365_02535 [Gloeocapsa sp. DLM2.Bin57]|nr:MAG: hypothetical protein EA365_02535 [Gloeocapsa sp. DLM2.Bin57]